METLIYFAVSAAVICTVFAIGGIVADYIFPHIPSVERYIDRLAGFEDVESDEESCEEVNQDG